MIFNLRFESEGRAVSFYDGRFPVSALGGISENIISLSTTQGANQDGVSVGGLSVAARSITITGDIRNPDTDRAVMLAAILPKASGRLILEQTGTPPVYLDVEVVRTPTVENVRGVQTYQVAFTAPSPFWKTVEQVNRVLWGYEDLGTLFSVAGDGSGVFENFGEGEVFNISLLTALGYVTVWNTGNVPLPVIIEATARGGNVTDFEVYQVGTSPVKKIKYIGTLNDGERVIIDTNYGKKSAVKEATDSSTVNAFGNIDESSDWGFTLPVGVSQIGYNAASGRDSLQVIFKHPAGIYSGV